MPDSVMTTVLLLRERGVLLELRNGKLRCKGAIAPNERRLLVENAPIVGAILNPDVTLPDDLFIPAGCPNDNASIEACIDSQRIAARAA